MSDTTNERTCVLCSKSFSRRAREAKSRYEIRKFCSKACHYKARRNDPADAFSRPEAQTN